MNGPVALCLSCARFQGSKIPDGEFGFKCEAYDLIPVEILAWLVDHHNPYPGDHGLQFKPKDTEKAYNPDQERDEHGRWTSGGGSGGTGRVFVSPHEEGEMTLSQAQAAIGDQRHAMIQHACEDVDKTLGMQATEEAAVGVWTDGKGVGGAENSLISSVTGNPSMGDLRIAGAMKGYLANQKQVLIFREGAGDSYMASFHATGDLQSIHEKLTSEGVNFHTLQPESGGAKVFVLGEDRGTATVLARVAEGYGTHLNIARGQHEFIGTDNSSGTDAAQRSDARRVYEGIIGSHAGTGDGGLTQQWASLVSRWGALTKAIFGWLRQIVNG